MGLISALIYIILNLFFNNSDNLFKSTGFGYLLTISIFLLPATLSKLVTGYKYFGFYYVIFTLIYPLSYLLIIGGNKFLGLEISILYEILAILIVIGFLSLVGFFIIRFKEKDYLELQKGILLFILAFGVLLSLNLLLGIRSDALLSLDFLQHNSIAKQIEEGKLCLIPNQCSNLFLKVGYTTYLHTVQSIATINLKMPLGSIAYILNIVFSSVSFMLIYNIVNKNTKNGITSILLSLLALLVFDLGAHTFTFFLPQTFTFFLFLNFFFEDRLSPLKFIFAVILLFLNHFIIGTYLSFILIAFVLFFHDEKSFKIKYSKVVTLLVFIFCIITLVANLKGFSIEKVFQIAEVEELGFMSNLYFPHNLLNLLTQFGLPLLLALLGSIYFLGKKSEEKDRIVLFCIFYFFSGLTVYFLAPTYANKFLIGITVFSPIIIYSFLQSFKFNVSVLQKLILIILLSTIPLYLINFQSYLKFFIQNTGKISAITKDDDNYIVYLSEKKELNCSIISDPYSQLMILSHTRYKTVNGQYLSLDSRKKINKFINTPNQFTYVDFIGIETGLKKPCVLLTSRMNTRNKYTNSENAPWLSILYEYEINNNYGFQNISKVLDILFNNGYQIQFQDANNIFLTPRQ